MVFGPGTSEPIADDGLLLGLLQIVLMFSGHETANALGPQTLSKRPVRALRYPVDDTSRIGICHFQRIEGRSMRLHSGRAVQSQTSCAQIPEIAPDEAL